MSTGEAARGVPDVMGTKVAAIGAAVAVLGVGGGLAAVRVGGGQPAERLTVAASAEPEPTAPPTTEAPTTTTTTAPATTLAPVTTTTTRPATTTTTEPPPTTTTAPPPRFAGVRCTGDAPEPSEPRAVDGFTVEAEVAPAVVRPGQEVRVTVTRTNTTGERRTFTHGRGGSFYVVDLETGRTIWSLMHGLLVTADMVTTTFEPGEQKVITYTWDQSTCRAQSPDGRTGYLPGPAPEGRYRLTFDRFPEGKPADQVVEVRAG